MDPERVERFMVAAAALTPEDSLWIAVNAPKSLGTALMAALSKKLGKCSACGDLARLLTMGQQDRCKDCQRRGSFTSSYETDE